jgi:hypothetical protein
MSRFDYVKYDDKATRDQATLKAAFESLASQFTYLNEGRAKALAITKLEEAYMWVGKALRDDQLIRNSEVKP